MTLGPKTDRYKLQGLRAVAEALGYLVVMRRVKAMKKSDAALTCPDIQKIYIDPKSGLDVVSTLAHEVGHAILMILRPPGHRSDDDTDFDLKIAENAADLIGKVLCATIGHEPDYTAHFVKAVEQIKSANCRLETKEAFGFLQGYCAALSDVLPSSVGAKSLAELAREIRGKALGQSDKEESDGLRFSRTNRS